MWQHILFGVAVVIFIGIRWELVPPPWAVVVVRIRDGMVQVTRGRITGNMQEALIDIITDEKLSRGWIAMRSDQRIIFSRGLSESLRQRIRNAIVNRFLD